MSACEPQGQTHEDANIRRLCRLGGVSRAGYYRCLMTNQPARADCDMRDQIQRVSLAHRHYGYRRIAAQLRREGHIVNAKRVLRLMREDNLLCLRAKPFVPHTTDSRHGFSVVPNRTRGLIPTGLDQIWVADITYVRLGEAFVYLAVVLDAYSRKVIGWALDDHLEARLAIQALDMAILARDPAPDSLIHHSDRGVQYACGDYTKRLEARRIDASMSRVANPYDNAKAESFMKTLKADEVNAKAYATIEDARAEIGAFIETVYNIERLHSALDYKPPAEFEAHLARSPNPQPKSEMTLSPK
jgi:transposase InsO family protein